VVPRSANPDPKLAAALKRLREDRGLSQEHVAWHASLSVSTLAKIEHAQTAPHWDSVMRILGALDVTLAELAEEIERGEAR
jgi:transcriptional regulator with XRE-family HTH domain